MQDCVVARACCANTIGALRVRVSVSVRAVPFPAAHSLLVAVRVVPARVPKS